MSPKISVIIPVYNTENYLANCLESLINQTFTDFEVLMVDDKSSDNSVEICRGFEKKDDRFKLVLHEKNLGPGAPRNTGLKIAQGEFVVFLDSDDMLAIDACEKLLNKAIKTKADFVLGRMHVLKNNKLTPVDYIETHLLNFSMSPFENLKNYEDAFQFLGSPVNRIYRKDFLIKNKIYFPENLYWEDVAFSFEVWNKARIVTEIPEIVYFRTIREDEDNTSITQTYGMKSFLDRDKIIEIMYKVSIKLYRKDFSILRKGISAINTFTETTKSIIPNAEKGITEDVDKWLKKHLKMVNKKVKLLNDRILFNKPLKFF
ncbi:MAG: glycosyltransferase family 2 protein [Bacillota bacterium]